MEHWKWKKIVTKAQGRPFIAPNSSLTRWAVVCYVLNIHIKGSKFEELILGFLRATYSFVYDQLIENASYFWTQSALSEEKLNFLNSISHATTRKLYLNNVTDQLVTCKRGKYITEGRINYMV